MMTPIRPAKLRRLVDLFILNVLTLTLWATGTSAPPPSLIVILADDLGFSDSEISTPNLDHMAGDGAAGKSDGAYPFLWRRTKRCNGVPLDQLPQERRIVPAD